LRCRPKLAESHEPALCWALCASRAQVYAENQARLQLLSGLFASLDYDSGQAVDETILSPVLLELLPPYIR